jgi:hypothetical protein
MTTTRAHDATRRRRTRRPADVRPKRARTRGRPPTGARRPGRPLPTEFLRPTCVCRDGAERDHPILGLSRLNYSVDTASPARLVHDEVQPQDQRGHRPPARLRERPPLAAGGDRPRRFIRTARTPVGARGDHRHGRREPRTCGRGAGRARHSDVKGTSRTAEIGRRKVLVPDSAHGTNPATAAMAGSRS